MSDDTTDAPEPATDPAAFAETIASTLAADLATLTDREVACSGEAGRPVPQRALLGDDDPHHHLPLACEGGGPLAHWLVPDAAARALAALQLGEAPAGAFDAAARSALDEILELASSSVARALGGRIDGALAPRLPSAPLAADAVLAQGNLLALRFRLEQAELWLALPADSASAWFGIEPGEALPLAVVDPDPESRGAAEALAAALGRPVWTLDPADLGDALFDELGESGAIVVACDLGARCGFDLIEALARDPRTRGLPLAAASAAPTRGQVRAAIRCGACTFLHQPWQADEIDTRLRAAAAGEPAPDI